MTFVKRLWLSSTLLVTAYASFGWHISNYAWFRYHPLYKPMVLALAIALAVLVDVALLEPLTYITRLVARWFRSDTVAFLTMFSIVGAVVGFLLWLQIFSFMVLIFSAEALARVDAQAAKLTERQAFWLLAVLSLIGLLFGWGCGQWISLRIMLQENAWNVL